MQSIKKSLSSNSLIDIIKQLDYLQGIDGLPKSNVIKYYFDNGSIVIRPSGTEPKLKIYVIETIDNYRKFDIKKNEEVSGCI